MLPKPEAWGMGGQDASVVSVEDNHVCKSLFR
jgi:hypothetical protein